MSGVPSAFILVLVEVDDLVTPEGVAVVLDLLMVAEPFVMVDDLVMPTGLFIVLDFVVTLVPGWVVLLVVVIFDELPLIVVAGAVVGVWARAAVEPSRLSETRSPKMRFIKKGVDGENMGLLRGLGPRSWLTM